MLSVRLDIIKNSVGLGVRVPPFANVTPKHNKTVSLFFETSYESTSRVSLWPELIIVWWTSNILEHPTVQPLALRNCVTTADRWGSGQ